MKIRPVAAGMGPAITPPSPNPDPRPTAQHHRRRERLDTSLARSAGQADQLRRTAEGHVDDLSAWRRMSRAAGTNTVHTSRGSHRTPMATAVLTSVRSIRRAPVALTSSPGAGGESFAVEGR